MFGLWRPGLSLETSGVCKTLLAKTATDVELAVRRHFAAATGEGADLVVGGLPFDSAEPALLFQPLLADLVITTPGRSAPSLKPEGRVPRALAISGEPDAAGYAVMVRRALASLAHPALQPFDKVVLARKLQVDLDGDLDPRTLAALLARDPSVTVFLLDLSQASGDAGHRLVGATPELLVSRRGLAVCSHPLAGSARRRRDPSDDRAAAEGLLASEKDRREHGLVVESILDQLAPLCAELSAPGDASLCSTASMWHLGTRIDGRLKGPDMPSAAGLAALLHPTPAVGGFPRERAMEVIRELEPAGRGFYAGAVGWCDEAGDGEWHVALRCAEMRPGRLTLHAGAGIVEGSVPEDEAAETLAKFVAILDALSIDLRAELRECAAL